jgi:AcrR family transcriptional regulator
MQHDHEHASALAGSTAEPASAERAARLRRAVTDAGGPTAVADRAGVNLGTLNTYLRGRDMRTEVLVKLAAATGVRLEWLAAGTGPMREAAPTSGVAEPRESAPQRALGLTWQADPDRLARAYQQALDGLVVLPGHRPDPRRLMQITLLIYDELTEAEQAAARADSEPPKSL